MALEGIVINEATVPGGKVIGVDTIGGDSFEVIKAAFGDEGELKLVSETNLLPVGGNLLTDIKNLLTQILAKLSVSTIESFVSDGSGVIVLANDYVHNSWNVFLRGTLVTRTDVTETNANTLTISVSTDDGDAIQVDYQIL